MYKSFILTILILLTIPCSAQFKVATYRDGKQAALSFTFDDGASDQLPLAVPQLEKRGWRGTFYIIGSFIPEDDDANGFTWKVIRDLAGRGHEIGNHTMTHRNLLEIPYEEAVREVRDCDSLLLVRAGIKALSFAYPFNAANARIKTLAEKGKVASRTSQTALGGRSTMKGFSKKLDETIGKGGWMVTMTHGIENGYDHFTSLESYIAYLDLIQAHEDNLWIAPFAEVASYLRERDAVKLEITDKGRKVTITPECNLDYRVFNTNLSLESSRKVRKASQGGKALEVSKKGGKYLIDFDPYGGEIKLKVSRR